MHTITFCPTNCMKNRISQTVKLNSLERYVSLRERLEQKKKIEHCLFFHALFVVCWPLMQKWNPCIQHRLAMANKKLYFSSYSKTGKNQRIKQTKAIFKFNFSLKISSLLTLSLSFCHQVFFPVFFTQGNNLAKFEKPWSKIRNHTFSVAKAVSYLIF